MVVTVRMIDDLGVVPQADWDRLVGPDNFFNTYRWLCAPHATAGLAPFRATYNELVCVAGERRPPVLRALLDEGQRGVAGTVMPYLAGDHGRELAPRIPGARSSRTPRRHGSTCPSTASPSTSGGPRSPSAAGTGSTCASSRTVAPRCAGRRSPKRYSAAPST